jgi:hypothetical protein
MTTVVFPERSTKEIVEVNYAYHCKNNINLDLQIHTIKNVARTTL